MVLLIAETGMRSIEVRNLDVLGEHRDIFYDRKIIQTRFGKGYNSSGPLTRLMPLSRPAEITLTEYEQYVRPQFKNYQANPALFLGSNGDRLSYQALHDSFLKRASVTPCVVRASTNKEHSSPLSSVLTAARAYRSASR
jgi:site-specific recombinase XerD